MNETITPLRQKSVQQPGNTSVMLEIAHEKI